MTGPVTWEVFTWAISGAVALLALQASLLWKLIEIRDALRADISALRTSLSDHKLEVARDYISAETFDTLISRLDDRMTRSFGDLTATLSTLNTRIDRVLETCASYNTPPPRR